MLNTISFVSLGPGDPELITLKGLRTLREADKIYCPGTTDAHNKPVSRAALLIGMLDVKTPVTIFQLPMQKTRTQASEVYQTLVQQLIADVQSGLKPVVAAEGDAGFYSSVQYIYEQLIATDIPCNRIPGVPAFLAAAATAGIHLVKQEEQLHVVPGKTTIEELDRLITNRYTLVIMKLTQCDSILRQLILQHPDLEVHYFENTGLPNAFYTTDISALQNRPFPYFSLLIIRPEPR